MDTPLIRSQSCKIDDIHPEIEKMSFLNSVYSIDEKEITGSSTYDKTNFKFKKYKSEFDALNERREYSFKIFQKNKQNKSNLNYGSDSFENLEQTQYVLLLIFFFVFYLILRLYKIHPLIFVIAAFILIFYLFRNKKIDDEYQQILNISEIQEKKDNFFDESILSQSLLNI